MCVAVIVESDKRIPKDHLKAMHEANPHGGGVAWIDGDQVHFRKGMSWEEIDAIQDTLPRPFLMHFRIATRGAKIPELTHPFPIGHQAFTEDLVGLAKGVLIHNGTWSDYRKYVPKGIDADKVSDTQIAAYMAAIDESILDDVKWSNAIMRGDRVLYRGTWQRFEGNLYSNLLWKRELYDWSAYRNWGTPTSRTTTPTIPEARKKGSHRENYNQSNGRTITKNHSKGANTVQSNGKTIAENRENKRRKRSSTVTYEEAVKTYSDTRLHDDPSVNMTRLRGSDWEGERLFKDNELPGYHWNSDGKLVKSRTTTTDFKSKSVKCPDCNEEIEQIPCPCDKEWAAEQALRLEALEIEDLTGLPFEDAMEVAKMNLGYTNDDPIGFNDAIPLPAAEEITERVVDTGDVEDMNAYGMGLSLDAMPSSEGDYLDPDWKAVDEAIRKQGIKI